MDFLFWVATKNQFRGIGASDYENERNYSTDLVVIPFFRRGHLHSPRTASELRHKTIHPLVEERLKFSSCPTDRTLSFSISLRCSDLNFFNFIQQNDKVVFHLLSISLLLYLLHYPVHDPKRLAKWLGSSIGRLQAGKWAIACHPEKILG